MPKPPSPHPSPDPRQQLGLSGEERVIAWLGERGWRVESHRFRMGRLEIDLVLRRGSLVAFVEVKTRRGQGYGRGREAVGWRKRMAIAHAADAWRLRHGRRGDIYRFDVVEIEVGPSGVRWDHIEDAWRIVR
ncbi:MAG: YraN family protein [Gemmatimonadales bacterium]